MTSRFVENIIWGRNFVWFYFIIGLTISIIWTLVLYKLRRGYYINSKIPEKRASAILSQFFSVILLTIFLSAFYTYKTGKQAIYHKEAILVYKGSNVRTGTDYIHLLIDDRQERFNPKKYEYVNLTNGDTLLLTIGKGKTNYDIIYEFNKK